MKKGLAVSIVFVFILAACSPASTPEPTSNPSPTVLPTDTAEPNPTFRLADTAVPNPTVPPPATVPPVPLPALTLRPGDFYFSVDGNPGFVFSRNVAGTQLAQYATLLDWSKAGGTRFVRVQLDSLGMGYTSTGDVDSNWAAQWERVLDQAEVDGVYVLLTFTAWYDWNGGSGYSTWKNNPINQASGGPAKNPGELFQKGSPTQTMWLNWMETVVKRWQGRRNILGWEIFSEVNLASGSTEANGIDFINAGAAVIRAADPSGRPVTAAMADTGTWPNFYRQTNIDFINLHPYPPSGQLDRAIVSEVRNSLALYHRPLLIGESGLSAETPDSSSGKLTVATNAEVGVRHAIWAGIVSGAMNGRALWWEDGVGIYFQNLGIPWMQTYKTEELPAATFVAGVDFTGFQPLTVTSSSGVWGAAVGNENSLVGWFRDSGSEPPTWNLKPVVSKQTVTLSVPGSAVHWRVDFYSTRDGTTPLGSIFATRQGNTITVPLPDFQDDIAFKASGR
jgi:hypothetical protein